MLGHVQNQQSLVLGVDETQHRIETLTTKRQNDRINLILSAAAKGDLAGLKHALKASFKFLHSKPQLIERYALTGGICEHM